MRLREWPDHGVSAQQTSADQPTGPTMPHNHASPGPGHPVAGRQSELVTVNTLPSDIAFLTTFGVNTDVLRACARRAAQMNVPASHVLLAHGVMSDVEYARCLALGLNLPFEPSTVALGEPFHQVPDPEFLAAQARMVAVQPRRYGLAGTADGSGRTGTPNSPTAQPDLVPPDFHLAPDGGALPQIDRLLTDAPELAERVSVSPLRANRAALMRRAETALTEAACHGLAERSSSLSARSVVTARQAVSLVLVLQALLVCWFFASGLVETSLHLVATCFYLGCVGIRLWAAMNHRPKPMIDAPRTADWHLPVYTVLVPLYDEAAQVIPLVKALDALDWPKERLEIKLVCEADDQTTLDAAELACTARGRAHFEVIRVPPSLPRTKPKALNYALQVSSGRLVTVYDAEDRPHPGQLREAHNAFLRLGQSMAVLQSPLCVINGGSSWFSRMFAIEYSALFDGLLPALDRARSFGPLGGTSNHFKRAALDHIGGWDPYNVTEDADLSVRLARAGLGFATLTLPTYETAPRSAGVWFGQRTRWFKGWMQTWLVHMRQPIRLWQQLGWKQFLVFHLMITGMILSALIHPLLWIGVFYYGTQLLHLGQTTLTVSGFFFLDLASILLGYATMAALALRTLPQRGLQALAPGLFGLPAYWLCLSVAAWRALHELLRRPHHWEKTEHNDPLDRKVINFS